MNRRVRIETPFFGAVVGVHWVIAIAAGLGLTGCHQDTQTSASLSAQLVSTSEPASDVAVVSFCGACHALPRPESFPRERWREEVEQGFEIYRQSGRTDLIPCDLEAAVTWFSRTAPESYDFVKRSTVSDDTKLFEPIELQGEQGYGAVSHLKRLDQGRFAICDLSTGMVQIAVIHDDRLETETIGEVADPAHVEPADLDDDGQVDYVVADLGSVDPGGLNRGTLWWFVQKSGTWKRIPLRMGMSRVCDVRASDFNEDGKQDLVVAEFGFRREGAIHLLLQEDLHGEAPSFRSEVLDPRNGPIHVPTVDLNDDGHIDIVTLVSQEHETIDVQYGNGLGVFRPERLHAAPDPSFGSSGIELVDMDGDGDLDVLSTNGDTFDDHLPKPFHSVSWLENTGQSPWRHHLISNMPGAYRAVAGDLDLDGDIDVVAVAMISSIGLAASSGASDGFDGVVWFEQAQPGEFQRHALVVGECRWPACELIDVDGDSDLDVVTGPFARSNETSAPLTLWRNKTR